MSISGQMRKRILWKYYFLSWEVNISLYQKFLWMCFIRFLTKNQPTYIITFFILSLIAIKEGRNLWSEEWTEHVMKWNHCSKNDLIFEKKSLFIETIRELDKSFIIWILTSIRNVIRPMLQERISWRTLMNIFKSNIKLILIY